MSNVQRYTGDDWEFTASLKVNGVARDVIGATIKAAVVDGSSTSVISAVTLVEEDSWYKGDITILFPAASTVNAPIGVLYVEVQVDQDGKKKTYGRQPFEVIQGVID